MNDALRPGGEATPRAETSRLPVSVAIPVRDEAQTIAALLDSLLNQTHPPEEIIVADGGSKDGTAEKARGYAARGVITLEIGPAFPGRGRNAAIRAARHEWIALVDAGCVPDVGWIEALLEPLTTDATLEVVQGEHVPILDNEWARAQALTLVAPRQHGTSLRPPSIVSTLIRRSVWERVGGFREDLRAAEDLLFFEAIAAAGARVARAPKAIVRWRLSPGPIAAFRRLSLYSRHHLRAGLFRTWHLRVLSMDLAALFLLWVLPRPEGMAALLAAIAGRTFLTAWKRRDNVPGPRPLTPLRLVRVAVLIALADIAAWLGVLHAALGRRRTP
ncbi:MAG TPA: glycosyltransferase [Vicinamibacteria bacterium]|nr:glycosyltransferase [Vicinamibacteria bacterium]